MWDMQGSSDAVPNRFGFRLFSTKFSSFLRAKSGPVQDINSLLTDLNKNTIKMDSNEPQIGYAELYAVYRAVLEVPGGGRIKLRVDNMGVVAGLSKGRFRNEAMNALLGIIYEEMQVNNKFLDTVWVDTRQMERLGSDGLSRARFKPEGYTVAPAMVPKIQRLASEMFGLLNSNITISFRKS